MILMRTLYSLWTKSQWKGQTCWNTQGDPVILMLCEFCRGSELCQWAIGIHRWSGRDRFSLSPTEKRIDLRKINRKTQIVGNFNLKFVSHKHLQTKYQTNRTKQFREQIIVENAVQLRHKRSSDKEIEKICFEIHVVVGIKDIVSDNF